MKVQVSHRLDEELLLWATEYGETRGRSRAVVIEEALKHFQALASGGVPDLPAEEPMAKSRPRLPEAPLPSLLATRQARLAKEMGWSK